MSSSSSEEQIYKRRKKTHTKPKSDLEDLFADVETSSSTTDHNPTYQQNDTYLLQEIFGTGEEYSYIYNKPEKTSTKKEEEKQDFQTYKEEIFYDSDEVYCFLLKRTIFSKTERETVNKLLSGYSVFFIYFHTHSAFSIFELIEMKSLLIEFSKMRGEKCWFSESKAEFEEIKGYKQVGESNLYNLRFLLASDVLLSVGDFYENYANKQKIHDPLDLDFEVGDFLRRCFLTQECYTSSTTVISTSIYEDTSNNTGINTNNNMSNASMNNITPSEDGLLDCVACHYAGNPLFIKLVVDFYFNYACVDGKYVKDDDCLLKETTYKIIDDDFEILANLFTNRSIFDDFRRKVLKLSISKIKGLNRKVEAKLRAYKKSKASQEVVFNIVDRILNGARSIKEDEFAFGILETKNTVNFSIVNHHGKNVGFFQSKDYKLLQEKVVEFAPSFLVYCGIDRSLKYSLVKLKEAVNVDVLVVENELVFKLYGIQDLKKYTHGIVKRVINPELEFCKILSEKIMIEFTPNQKLLSFEEVFKALKLGIQISLCFLGVDVNKLVLPEYAVFLPLLNLDTYFVELLEGYGIVEDLLSLKTSGVLIQRQEKENYFYLNDKINDFDNACVFLRVYLKGKKTLDSYIVHPKNYGFTKILCDSVLESEDADNISKVLENPCLIKNIDFSLVKEHVVELENVRNYILANKRAKFDSVTDEMIFTEIIGDLNVDLIYEGRIKSVFPNFYLVEICVKQSQMRKQPLFNKEAAFFVDVYVKKEKVFYMNQLVKIEVQEKSFFNLSYKGIIKSIERVEKRKHVDHFLFMNLSTKEAEDYLLKENKAILLRRSGQTQNLILVLKLNIKKENKKHNKTKEDENNLFLHIKIDEHEKLFIINNKEYENLNELISVYIRRLFITFNKIKEHEKYCESEEKAVDLVKGKSETIQYCFFASKKYPGRIGFMFCKNQSVRCEYLKIGDFIYFEGREFKSLDEFLNFRKRR